MLKVGLSKKVNSALHRKKAKKRHQQKEEEKQKDVETRVVTVLSNVKNKY